MRPISAIHVVCGLSATLLVSCGAPIIKTDYLFVPVVRALSGTGAIGAAEYVESSATFRNINDLATVAFYKGSDSSGFKRVESNAIQLYSANRQELVRFNPNKEDLLLIKSGFKPGYDYSANSIFNYTEYAFADDYIKDINIDISQVKNGVFNTDFALVALNVGNSTLKDLKIIDVLPKDVTYINSKYATEDEFVPLNADLAKVNCVHHKIIPEGNKTILVFDIDGEVKPAEMVEIVVNIDVRMPTKKINREN
jgi:hypothetical protein